jgi:hypothetical protein
MKISKNLLRQIIKEELSAIKEVTDDTTRYGDETAATHEEIYPKAVEQLNMLRAILTPNSAFGRFGSGNYKGSRRGHNAFIKLISRFEQLLPSIDRFVKDNPPK